MPVGRPWVTRRENAPQNIDYSAMWSSSRCPEIHAVKAMYLYLFLGANLEDQTASVFIETRCSPSVSTAGEQFPYLTSRIRDRLHLRIGDNANCKNADLEVKTTSDAGRQIWILSASCTNNFLSLHIGECMGAISCSGTTRRNAAFVSHRED